MLNTSQKRHLKALAHTRKAILIVGANGLTPAVLGALDEALKHHELLKVRVNAADREARAALINHICNALGSALVQQVGHIATLFRRNPEAPRLQLP